MARPRKYADVAEKCRAYRMRKKLKASEHPPELDDVAKALHKLYKKRAAASVGYAEEMLGKTPYETLLKVVVYQLLFDRHLGADDQYRLPPLSALIKPAHGSDPDLPGWIINPDKMSFEAALHVDWADDSEEEEDEEDEEDGNE